MHQASYREMCKHQAVEFLTNKFRCFAPQAQTRAAQMGLEFVERGLDLPTLVIKCRQIASRCVCRIKDRRHQRVGLVAILHAVQSIAQDTDRERF